jgi:hypothetical protein
VPGAVGGAVALLRVIALAGEVASGADALGVCREGGAHVFVVVAVSLDGRRAEAELAVEGWLAPRWGDRLRSSSAATRRRVTWGDPAPASRDGFALSGLGLRFLSKPQQHWSGVAGWRCARKR